MIHHHVTLQVDLTFALCKTNSTHKPFLILVCTNWTIFITHIYYLLTQCHTVYNYTVYIAQYMYIHVYSISYLFIILFNFYYYYYCLL